MRPLDSQTRAVRRLSRRADLATHGLALALLALGLLKLVSRYRVEFALPAWAYYLAASVEIAVGALLLFRPRLTPIVMAACGAFLASIVVTLVHDGDCGCLAALGSRSRALRVAISALLLASGLKILQWRCVT